MRQKVTFTQTWNYYFQARVLLEPQDSMTLSSRWICCAAISGRAMSPRWFHNLPSANIRCSRNIQMTPLRKVEMALRPELSRDRC